MISRRRVRFRISCSRLVWIGRLILIGMLWIRWIVGCKEGVDVRQLPKKIEEFLCTYTFSDMV